MYLSFIFYLVMYFILQCILLSNAFYLVMYFILLFDLVWLIFNISLLRAKYETTSFGASYVNISPKLAGSEVIPECIQNSHKLSLNSISGI